MKASIDVLLAAWQGAQYLPEQLDSLNRQLDRDFTVLCRDDDSEDATPAILQAECASNTRFRMAADSGTHLGAAGSFFSLLGQSKAAYFALCDQDDRWAPDHLFALRRAMEQAEEACDPGTPILIYGDCAVVDGEGKLLYPSLCLHQGWKREALTLKQLLVQNNATGCTMLINAPLRDLVLAHLPQEPVLHDWFIALTAASFGAMAFVDMPTLEYRQHGSNAIGASRASMPVRAANALKHGDAAKARIALTYENAQLFRKAYGDDLPAPAAECVDAYLATRDLPRLRRVLRVQHLGYRMQTPLFRLGQLVFG